MKKKIFLSLILICLGILVFGITVSAETYGDLTYEIANGEITITDCNESASGELIIPSTINNYPVTSIGMWAFSGCTSLKNITIPDSVTSIGRGAFKNCDSLKSLSIPMDIYGIDTASRFGNLFGYTTLDAGPILAYYAQPSYPKISEEYTSGKYVPSETIFQNYTSTYAERHVGYAYNHYRRYYYYNIPYSLKKIIITNDTEIGESAFYNCSYIEDIVLNNKITKIGNSAFYNCTGLANAYYFGTPEEWALVNIGTNNECLTKNIIFVKYIRANKSDDGKIIIEPVNIESGKTVVLALYNGDILSETIPVTYTGELISLTPTKDYTSAKVIVWEDLISMKPVCEAVEL